MKRVISLVVVIFMINIFYSGNVYASETLDDYVLLLQVTEKGSSEERELREEIIELALSLKELPDIPEEATKYLARGEAAVEMAKDKEGFLKAAEEFKNALNIAPWFPNAYYNLGLLQDKAGEYTQAIENLNFYLMAAPDSSDREDVQKLIYKIEYRAEETSNSTDKNSYGSAALAQEDKGMSADDLMGTWTKYEHAGSSCFADGERMESFGYRDYYNLTPTGDRSFRMQFSRMMEYFPDSNRTRPLDAYTSRDVLQKTFDMDINGKDLTGTATCWFSGAAVSVSKRTFPVTGRIAKNGESIIITENHTMPDWMSGGAWKGPAKKLIHTFERD